MIRKHYNLFDMIKQPWYECFSSIFYWVQTFFEPVQNFKIQPIDQFPGKG